MAYLKRVAMPKSWPLPRKGSKYVLKPVPGPHPLALSLPLGIVLRDLLGYSHNSRESRLILRKGHVTVDNVVRKDIHFPVGLFDRLSFPKIDKHFTITLTRKGKLKLKELPATEATKKVCKVIRKQLVKGGKTQITLYDGKNFLYELPVKVGDSVVVDLVKREILGKVPLEAGRIAFVTGGKHVGSEGKVTGFTVKGVKRFVSLLVNKKTITIPVEKVFLLR